MLQCTLLNINNFELYLCLTTNCKQNFLGGGKLVHASCSLEVLGSQTGFLKGLKKGVNAFGTHRTLGGGGILKRLKAKG